MGDTGLEQSPFTLSKTPISGTGGTESGTLDSAGLAHDTDLHALIKVWSALPEHIKLAIKSLVEAVK